MSVWVSGEHNDEIKFAAYIELIGDSGSIKPIDCLWLVDGKTMSFLA